MEYKKIILDRLQYQRMCNDLDVYKEMYELKLAYEVEHSGERWVTLKFLSEETLRMFKDYIFIPYLAPHEMDSYTKTHGVAQ